VAYDLVFQDALVVDGSGLPACLGDVAVRDGRIVEVGRIRDGARRVIKAQGLALAPGFIDHHTHLDAQLLWDPVGSSSPHHGVTTVVTGNCGLTLMPAKAEHRDALVSTLARVEAIPRSVLEMGVQWRWGSAGEYLDALGGRLAVNAASHVGHCAVRQFVMGDDASERAATPGEIAAMQELVRDAMRAGAMGFSTNQNPRHMRLDGKPIPSRLATEGEILALAEVVGEFNAGVIQAIRGVPTVADIDWYVQLARVSRRPVLWNIVVHSWSTPNRWREQLDRLEEVFQEGVRPYAITNVVPFLRRFTLRNAQTFDEFPAWRALMIAPLEQRQKAFSDSGTREVLRREIKEFPGIISFHRRWDLVTVTEAKLPKNRRLKGMSVTELARLWGKDELDAFLDLSLEEELETLFQTSSTNGDDQAVGAILRSPYVVIGASDAGAHVVYDAAFGYCTTLLGRWVRERKLMTLESAVHKLTFMIASLFGFHDRGLVRPGWAADLVLFDPATVGALEPENARDYPGGTRRMIQRATGVHYTVVNGQVVIENGEYTGSLSGRILRNAWYQAQHGQ
jgi:N-acyl-D-aspartate/D-glutamate deacylase